MAISSRTPRSLAPLPNSAKTMLSNAEMKDYVYFSDLTKGQNGRAVKIKVDLFPRFAALVDPNSHEGQTIIRQIENLRANNAGSAGVYGNANSAFRFMLKTRKMDIFFAVLDGAQSGRKEVYIGEIKVNLKSDDQKAGLYVYDSFQRKIKNYTKTYLNDKTVYLNGQCNDWKDAYDRAQTLTGASRDNLALFYSPSSVINDMGIWNSNAQSNAFDNSASELREIIKFNYDKKVNWVAEGEGADVLSSALDGLNINLKAHRFRLIDPLTNTPALLQKLQANEIRPTIDEIAPVEYSGLNRATNLFMEAQKQSILNALKLLRVKGFAEEPHREMIATLEGSVGQTPMNTNKTALTNTAALNNRVAPSRNPANHNNMAGLSFIAALKRI